MRFGGRLTWPTEVLSILWVLVIIATTGLIVATIISCSTLWLDGYWRREFCLRNDCINEFAAGFSQAFVVLKATLDIVVAVATAGGIVVALLSYLSNVRVTALANHISHLNLFQQYVASEISKRDRLAQKSFDTHFFYNKIFSASRSGLTDVSFEYLQFVDKMNNLILFSNDQSVYAKGGSYRYKPHQERVCAHLRTVGIFINPAPRNDFYEIEGQIISLIQTINRSMCAVGEVPEFLDRRYI